MFRFIVRGFKRVLTFLLAYPEIRREADWGGRLRRRFCWRLFRMRWGRFKWRTNCCGDTLEEWWEWEILNET